MSTTAQINAIHIAFTAEAVAAADQLAGTYAANLASNPYFYAWQGQQQIIPVMMNGDPEGFAAGLRAALPAVNTLRLSFNAYSFNADGSMAPEYEAFLEAVVAQGFQIIMTYHDGDMQRLGSGDGLTAAEIEAELTLGNALPRAEAAFAKMFDWMAGHGDVAAAVWGYELANEPAAYERVVDFTATGSKTAAEARMVQLYARHMASLAEQVAAKAPEAKILVGGWGFSGRFQEFADNQVDGVSAADFLRAALGDALVWSAHAYPGWHPGADATDPAEVWAALDTAFAAVLADDVLITETNLSGATLADPDAAASAVSAFARVQEWFADNGVGLTWSPGAQAGGSSLVTVDSATRLRFLHQHSFAFAMNAFSLGDHDPDHAGAEAITAAVIAGKLRNEVNEADYLSGTIFDPVNGLGTAFGHDGDDTLAGAEMANNFLYGGTGRDVLTGAGAEDFLFGQDGDDVLLGGAGADFLFGGRGDDLLRGGAGADVLEGGAGRDRFDASEGSDLIADFDLGDALLLGRGYANWAAIAARMGVQAVNGAAVDDVVITHADGTTTTILDAAGIFGAAGLGNHGATSWVEGTAAADRITAGWEDFDGQRFGTIRKLAAGGGADQVAGTGLDDTLDGGTGNDTLAADAGRDLIAGGTGNDLIRAGDGADTLSGGDGADWLYGGAGDDAISSGAGRDRLFGEAGNDRLMAGVAGGWLDGGMGNDVLVTARAATVLRGGAGNDQLIAALDTANQRMNGGAGADSFIFTNASARGRTTSVIEDFSTGDRLVFEGRAITPGRLPASMSATHSGDDLVIRLEGAHRLILEDWFA